MKVTTVVCDRCGKEPAVSSFFVEIDRHLDAAGSTDGVGENVDICGECAALWLRESLMDGPRRSDHANGKKFLAWLGRRP